MLEARGLSVETQKLIPVKIDDLVVEQGFRADLIVQGRLLIEVKSVSRLEPVHTKQVLTYLRFLGIPLGLLMNFSGMTFREGLRRVVNNHVDVGNSSLSIHN